jgi:hypothetical protein
MATDAILFGIFILLALLILIILTGVFKANNAVTAVSNNAKKVLSATQQNLPQLLGILPANLRQPAAMLLTAGNPTLAQSVLAALPK